MVDDFDNLMAKRFGGSKGLLDDDDDPRPQRIAREQSGAMSMAERKRLASMKTKPLNFKVTPATHAFLKETADKMGISMTQVIERGIAMLAETQRGR